MLKVSVSGEDVVGKLLFVDFETEQSNTGFKRCNKVSPDVVDVSKYEIIHCKSSGWSLIILDKTTMTDLFVPKFPCLKQMSALVELRL